MGAARYDDQVLILDRRHVEKSQAGFIGSILILLRGDEKNRQLELSSVRLNVNITQTLFCGQTYEGNHPG